MIRLKTMLDFELWCEEHPKMFDQNIVEERIMEALHLLDDAYGKDRDSKSMGGYVFLFLSEESFNSEIGRILEHYHLKRELAEYCEAIEGQIKAGSSSVVWMEELFLLSSDDAILMIYPMKTARKKAKKGIRNERTILRIGEKTL